MSNKVSDLKGLPYAGNGPSVNDDGTPMLNREIKVVGNGSDTTSLTATNVEPGRQSTEPSFATMGPNRSAGENAGTGHAIS